MKENKYYIALDDFERRVVVNCMNEMRNKLIAEGCLLMHWMRLYLRLFTQNRRDLKLYIRRFDYGTVSEIHYRRKNGA